MIVATNQRRLVLHFIVGYWMQKKRKLVVRPTIKLQEIGQRCKIMQRILKF